MNIPCIVYDPCLEQLRLGSKLSLIDPIAGIHFDNDVNKRSAQRARTPKEVIELIQRIEQSRQNGRK